MPTEEIRGHAVGWWREEIARRKPLGIPELTAAQAAALGTLYQPPRDGRRRIRAPIVLLAGAQRLTVPTSARIVRESDQTVRTWLQDRLLPERSTKSTDTDRDQVRAA